MNARVTFQQLRPYLGLALVALLAYAPVSFMIYSLKNDIISIEYPIKYHISECIRNGVSPLWFNSWAMGFPLDGLVTWSLYSPPELLSALIPSSIYLLHLEFIFYISLSGWTFYYCLKRHFIADNNIAWLLGAAYMLSGFNTGSSQWLLYITASAFLPLVVSTLMSLLKQPGWKNRIQFAVVFYIAFTTEYLAFSIILIYLVVFICIIYLARAMFRKQNTTEVILALFITALLCIGLCAVPALHTWQELQYMKRGLPIAEHLTYFDANSMTPEGLESFLLPLTSVKMNVSNTEGSMMDSYMGLLTILVLPATIYKALKEKRATVLLCLFALLFLLLSMGQQTPLRNMMNIFPGFAYFRNAGLFRLYFIFCLLLFIAANFCWKQTASKTYKKLTGLTFLLLSIFYLLMTWLHLSAISDMSIYKGAKYIVSHLTYQQTIWVNSSIQIILLALMWIAWKKNKKALIYLSLMDLVINTLLCLPFYTVSSYSPSTVNNLLQRTKSFSVPAYNVSQIPSIYTRENAIWYNVNVFGKEVTSQPTYAGSLYLKNYQASKNDADTLYNHKVLYAETNDTGAVKIISYQPDMIVADVNTSKPVYVRFLQNYYPGWHAYYNQQSISIVSHTSSMAVEVPGRGRLVLRYEKKGLLLYIILTDLAVLLVCLYITFIKIRARERQS